MTVIQTDDAARQQEGVWLGPVNSPWPFEATYKAWLIGLGSCLLLMVVAGVAVKPVVAVLLPGPWGYLVMVLSAVTIGLTGGVLFTRWVGRFISPERPLAHHAMILVAEVTGPRERVPTTHRIDAPSTLWVEEATKTTHRIVPPTFKD